MIPTEENIATTESVARHLDRSEWGRGAMLRCRMQRCLEQSKQPTSNLLRNERSALRMLRKDHSIVILLADKGNAMHHNAGDYEEKMKPILNNGSYCKLKGDATREIERRISENLIIL